MMNRSNLSSAHRRMISCVIALLCLSPVVPAGGNQAGDDPGLLVFTTRKAADKPTSQPRAKYSNAKRPLTKQQAELANRGAAAVGVTVWRLRSSTADDAVEIRDLIQPGGDLPAQEVTPERVAMDAALTEGQMVRLSIESLRKGYLYVIDRPRYADGKYGDPYMIFPTQRIGVSNLVTAGQTVQIPGSNARPDYFVLERGKSPDGQMLVSEELIVIVKPEPFESFRTPPEDRKRLTQASVEALIEKYKSDVEETDDSDGAGKVITKIEKLASKDSSIRLSRDDPYPQTLYRLAVKPDDPMLIRFELKVKGKEGQ